MAIAIEEDLQVKFFTVFAVHSTLWLKKGGETGMIQKGKEDSEVMLLLHSYLCFKLASKDQ